MNIGQSRGVMRLRGYPHPSLRAHHFSHGLQPLAFSLQPFLLTALTPGLTAKLTAPTIKKPPSLLGPDGLTAKTPGGYPPVGHRKGQTVDAPPPPARPLFHPPRRGNRYQPLAFLLTSRSLDQMFEV